MEKFMYLFRGEPYAEQPTSEAAQAHMQKWTQWMKSLAQKGILVGGEPLEVIGKQVSGKNKVVTDGPYTEAKELVGGYLIVNAKDINEAVEISKDCPALEVGGKIEVRLLQKIEM